MAFNIKLCIGSSCFIRGNNRNLKAIEEFIEKHDVDAELEFCGSLCEQMCATGPNIEVNGTWFNKVDEGVLADIFNSILKMKEPLAK